MQRGSSLIAIEVKGGREAAFKLSDELAVILISNNLGDAKSLITHPGTTTHARFTEAVSLAERFGGETPWLDDYAAHSPAEFFAVTCEAYFVSRERFGAEFPELVPLYDGLFQAAVSRPR